jgi:prepilin peptidase dependent protein B
MLIPTPHPHTQRTTVPSLALQRGLSVVELMIGMVMGLFLIGGALVMMMSNVDGSRNMLVEARINQDMRAAADIISRDLKRSGYWASAVNGVTISFGATAASINPYTNITCTTCLGGTSTSEIVYNYSKDNDDTVGNAEFFGFRLNGGGIQMQVSNGSWQPITDTNILNITQFTLTETSTAVSVGNACELTPTTNTPTLTVRQYDLLMTGQSTVNPAVSRTLQSRVRVRNDQISGACPV